MGAARHVPVRLITAAAVVAVALVGSGLAAAGEKAPPDATIAVVIDGGGEAARQAVRDVGGSVTGVISILDGVTAQVPASRLSELEASLPDVQITPDVAVTDPHVAEVEEPASSPTTSLDDVSTLIGADALHERGITGAGVDVAVIDSGIAPVPGLDDPRKVVNGPDLSFDSQNAATRYLDGYGHGTHIAGIIAASATPTAGVGGGVAPGARLVNVKVGAGNGAVDVSQLLAAIDWVVQHKNDNGMNIRVLTLAVGTDTKQRAALDPLAYAADVAWRSGIVVVAAVGNDGRSDHRVSSPAIDPNILAVGATDSLGSTDPAQSGLAAFSSRGNGKRTADLLAPGARIASLRVPGSHLDQSYPQARRGTNLFRGSGTSQSTAVVSGAAALLLQQRPELTNDQVKLLLDNSGPKVRKTHGMRQLDVAAAAAAPAPSGRVRLKTMTGDGSLQASRGSAVLTHSGVTLTGERDIFGNAFNGASWSKAALAGASWSGGKWNGASWSGASWSGASWSGASWSGASWSGASWSGASWSGASWSGASWSGASWSGASWSGASWSGASWSGASWSGASWSGASWSGASWSGATWYGNAWD